jgi:hypothetical protein
MMKYFGAAAIGAVLFGAVSISSSASAFGGFWAAGWNGGWQADGWHGGWCLRPGSAAGFGLSHGPVADCVCDDDYRHPRNAYAPGGYAPAPKVANDGLPLSGDPGALLV